MIRVMLILSVLALSACGADGPPIRPTVDANIFIGPDGVDTSTGITLQSGPVSIGVSL